jgi:hypothetical protein
MWPTTPSGQWIVYYNYSSPINLDSLCGSKAEARGAATFSLDSFHVGKFLIVYYSKVLKRNKDK